MGNVICEFKLESISATKHIRCVKMILPACYTEDDNNTQRMRNAILI